MNSAKAIPFLLAAVLLLGAVPGWGQTAPETAGRGSIGPHFAAGSVNGLRVGLRCFVLRPLSLEASAGWMQITLLRENERKEYTPGYSVTVGGNWYTHPDASISPTLSLLGVYTSSGTLPDGFKQTRVAIVPALGSEYYFHEGFSVFFRFGPAFQFSTESGQTEFETATQFDGGVSLLF